MEKLKLPGREDLTLGMDVQMFDAVNHHNFGLPDNNLADFRFGRIFYMAMPPTDIPEAGLGSDASLQFWEL